MSYSLFWLDEMEGGSACERSERSYASELPVDSVLQPNHSEGLASSEALGKKTLGMEVL